MHIINDHSVSTSGKVFHSVILSKSIPLLPHTISTHNKGATLITMKYGLPNIEEARLLTNGNNVLKYGSTPLRRVLPGPVLAQVCQAVYWHERATTAGLLYINHIAVARGGAVIIE